MQFVITAFTDADVFLLITDVFEDIQLEESYLLKLQKTDTPILLLINKIDKGNEELLKEAMIFWTEKVPNANIFAISALEDFGVKEVFQKIIALLPESPAFYPKDQLTDKPERFFVNDTDISFSKSEIMKEVECFPERFSPNVIMRPLYQEVILPNLCYIGGGGELAYWLQLKSYFNSENITFPMLLLRNSVLITTSKQIGKADKLGLSIKELFKKQEDLIADKIRHFSTFNIDFTPQIELLQNQFLYLHEIAKQTDKSFSGAVSAQEKKQLKGLINLEKRLLKAQKRKLNHLTSRIIDLQNELFPRENLQERQLNFSELYMLFGTQLIEQLVLNLQPLKGEFLILEL